MALEGTGNEMVMPVSPMYGGGANNAFGGARLTITYARNLWK